MIADHFFSHLQCPGAVCGFWSFYKGGKGPYLGVFPILLYKRPQGEEGFFLGIRMAVTWVGFVFQGPNLLAQFPTKAQVHQKRVGLKRHSREEVGIGKIPTPMLGF